MSIAQKVTPNTRFSSLSLDKFIKSRKNLSQPTPKLWPHDVKRRFLITNDEEVDVLTLAHPILRKLESSNSIGEFNQIHAQLVVTRLSQHSLATSRAVKKLCSLCEVAHAVSFFKGTREPDAFLCNTIMRTYVNMNDSSSATRFYYDEMVGTDVAPNHYTFPIVVKGFVVTGSLIEGEKVHGRVLKLGFESDLFVRNALIHMYSVFRKAKSARLVFDVGPVLDLVSWNSMIDGHVKNGEVNAARQLFDEMTERDVFSWNSMIAGYVAQGDMARARWLFDRMPFRDIVSWNCIIDGCARIGNVSEARSFFESMPLRNVVSWNTMLALYVRVKGYTECLSLFNSMLQEEVIKPNSATLVSVLTACANTGDLNMGHLIYSYMKDNDIEADVLLSTALLTMYAKCGTMELARKVFDQMPDKSVVSWNAMIMGYGIHGQGEKALEMFLEMEKRGQKPNEATFVSILSACTHSGMVLEGWWCFSLISRVYNIQPKVEHYGCMVDLLARAGLVKDSGELVKEIPTEAGSSLWGALLSACRTHSHIELGEIVAKRLIELDPTDVGPYVLLSNMYAAEGNWDAVENVRMMMKAKGLQKQVASSLIQLGGIESTESSKDAVPHQRSMIYSMLREFGTQIKMSCRDSRAVKDQE